VERKRAIATITVSAQGAGRKYVKYGVGMEAFEGLDFRDLVRSPSAPERQARHHHPIIEIFGEGDEFAALF